jgi:uncharacterized membrane protein YkvA (DUF1232 family)
LSRCGSQPATTVPSHAKLVARAVAAYALSPDDLIPRLHPDSGLSGHLIIVTWAFLLAIRLIPPQLMAEFCLTAAERLVRPVSRTGLLFVLAVCLCCIIFFVTALTKARQQ